MNSMEVGRTVGRITWFPKRSIGWQKLNNVFVGTFGKLDVAVKRVLTENWDVQTDKRGGQEEDDILSRLRHENIVRYFLTETTPDFIYTAFELCNYNLAEWLSLSKTENWDPNEKPVLLYQACKGLSYLHDKNIIHRDIKPENILVNKLSEKSIKISGNSQFQAKICDFGISREIQDGRSSGVKNTGTGTTIWMAPEILRACKNQAVEGDKLSRASDVFSFGCVMYWLLTNGQHPFVFGKFEQLTIENNIAVNYKQCINLSTMKIQHVDSIRLIFQMIAETPANRPPAWAVLKHHFFFRKVEKLDLIISLSNATEAGIPSNVILNDSDITSRYFDWPDKFDLPLKQYVRKHVGRRTPYNENYVMDLARFYRNVSNHRSRVPHQIKSVLGLTNSDEEFLEKIQQHFPFLLDDLWMAFQAVKRNKDFVDIERKFYKTDYQFRNKFFEFEEHTLDKFRQSLLNHSLRLVPTNPLPIQSSVVSSSGESESVSNFKAGRSHARTKTVDHGSARMNNYPYHIPSRLEPPTFQNRDNHWNSHRSHRVGQGPSTQQTTRLPTQGESFP